MYIDFENVFYLALRNPNVTEQLPRPKEPCKEPDE